MDLQLEKWRREREVEDIDEATAVRHWLRVERDDAETDDGLTDEEVLQSLMHNMPGPSAYIWQYRPADWYRITLTGDEFRQLRPVPCPDNHTWDALCDGGTIMDGARRIREESESYLKEETKVNVEKIRGYQQQLWNTVHLPPLVIGKRKGCHKPRVLDGNHRATAIALHLLENEEYIPIEAYIGIGANPVREPVRQRICFTVRRLLHGKRSALF